MLVEYPWREIFSVNIDDLVEYIYKKANKDLFVQNKKRLSQEPDQGTILYKLHGCVNNPDDGFIFSDSEYTSLISKRLDSKLNRFADAMQNRNVIFVGAQVDEPDIKYYLDVYESAGCKYRTNRIVFITPKPNRYVKSLIKRLNVELIEATAEEFLEYVKKLNYNPDELRKSVIRLNYDGVYRLTNLIETFEKPYESRLYYGDFCNWQDAADGWVIETDSYSEAKEKLNKLIELDEPVSCFSIYGPMFSGKSCMLKTMGLYLASLDYDVLEYKGKRLNRSSIVNYITHTSHKKIAIIIDNGSYYYEQIESILLNPIEGKRILILTGAREYYHERKKYYLEGNTYSDYKLSPYFSDNDPIVVIDKLNSKSHLMYMASMQDKDRITEVKRKQNIINLIVALTYGKVSKRIKDSYVKLLDELTDSEQNLLLELAIFDILDIEEYPKELFFERYGKDISLDAEISLNKMGVIDFARMDEKGVALRNSLLSKLIIKSKRNNIISSVINILKIISKNVDEKRNDIWYFIFQGLMKEERLENDLGLKKGEIENVFLSVKAEYDRISYYWLQLGILFQKKGDYVSAYTYLEKSKEIRPNSYKIQHALARNYLRDANDSSDRIKAKELFEKGENLMKVLIDGTDLYISKAKPFSVTSYVMEKIKYLNKFNLKPSKAELRYMIDALDSVSYKMDASLESAMALFYRFMVKNDAVSMLRMGLDSPYLKYVNRKNMKDDIDVDEYSYD